jgi:xylan 1,4-beta-xylosidase
VQVSKTRMVRNPVLPGSHPDPSVLRVGPDYYLATSTFEWCPGVRLHHSRDLVHWRALGGALDGTRLLDLTGCPDSGGVWAPSLSYTGGMFHLVYSNVSTYAGGFTDCVNYLVTAPSIDGPWAEPVLLHARGFDASLFHDGEESWLVNLVHDWRPGHGGSAGLEATRYDRSARSLLGDPAPIAIPPQAGWIEGPNLYRRGDWYYLITADGGTGYQHQVTVSRSRSLTGPYERDPHGPVITARDHPELPLQKAGHGSLVETASGEWYLAYLVARPHTAHGPCVLGRETALATVTRLAAHWSTLRRPPTADWLSLTDRRSHLRLHGGRSPRSLVGPSLVARRVTAARCSFETTMEYRPRQFQHLAGITAYYNTRNWYFLHTTADDHGQAVLRLAGCGRGVLTLLESTGTPIEDAERVRLGLDFDGPELRFRYDTGHGWRTVGPAVDATVLSDEHAEEMENGQIQSLGFTGAFVGLWVWDLTGHGHYADFDDATYSTHDGYVM